MSLDKATVAKRYARALFELLSEKDQLESGMAELKELRQVFQDNPKLSTVLSDTSVKAGDREALLQDLSKTASPYIKNLIQMVYEYGRMDTMVAIIDQFKLYYNEAKHIVDAQVTTAVAISDTQRDQIATAFAKRVGANQVNLTSQVNPDIIGGAIVKSAGMIFDGSLQVKIQKLRQQLLA
ncbi:ATP synthase F1 subunit delta [Levilactobacillus tangyuanensis]|uniref:ATP synthase subunit delta n=1 Tax=Levilactobacillus tangyuanensis TaxID=2486021 RepID=A0ABW1TMX9_9LACO|nr:ATP synthase F1 subunit delta [Levilactobacillus tangyuanensis]